MNGVTIVQKVLECLAIHRSINKTQIIEYLNSKRKEIEGKLIGRTFKYPEFVEERIANDYAITEKNVSNVINQYSLSEKYIQDESEDVDYSKIMKSYLDFLSHLVIIKLDNTDGPRYELSLIGVMLVLAIITHPHQRIFFVEKIDNRSDKTTEDLELFYGKVSRNYADKLPLIFGKWALLTKKSQYAYQWFLHVLYQNIEDEFARAILSGPVPITLGGIKEYQESMQGIAFYTTTKLFEIYQGLLSALEDDDQNADSEIPLIHDHEDDQNAALLALLEKKKELGAFLKYADLRKFVSSLQDKKIFEQANQYLDVIYSSELPTIEKALANEVTFSFYINLARNRFIDYTDEGRYFLGEERDTDYRDTTDYHILRPDDFLRMILRSDKELKDMFLGWIADIADYQQRITERTKGFHESIRKAR